jgi:hypothetical protein
VEPFEQREAGKNGDYKNAIIFRARSPGQRSQTQSAFFRTDPVVATSDKCIRYWPRRAKLTRLRRLMRSKAPHQMNRDEMKARRKWNSGWAWH